MNKTSVHLRLAGFRCHVVVWIVLFVLVWSYLPAVSLAQQPTATLNAVTGTVLVNGQPKQQGTVLNAGDTIETQAGASMVLLLSDGSSLEVGENTQVNLSELLQAASGARNSRIKLMWGWMRAKLSPDHQKAGSSFQIDTPNAVIGVKFSQPDVEVRYDPAKQETTGVAHTVQLTATNILTNEELLVPVGSSVIIVGATITIIAGILAIAAASEAGTASAAVATTESAAATSAGATTTTTAATTTTTTATSTTTASTATGSTGASSAGMGTGTKVLIGAGAAVAVGGGVALGVLANQDNEESVSFTGTFMVHSGSITQYHTDIYTFVQNETSVTGAYEFRGGHVNPECTTHHLLNITGTMNGEQLEWSWPSQEDCCPCLHLGTCCTRIEGGNYSARLFNDGNSLNVNGPSCAYPTSQVNVDYSCVGVINNVTRQ